MESHLGRPLVDGEIVHHINTDKCDNRIENLHLCEDAAEHQRIHRSLDALVPRLLAAGVISFNRDESAYQLCEIDRWRPI